MRIEGERFLVTGGLGFIGRHLVRALAARGASVVVFDREARSLESRGAPEEARQLMVLHGDLLSGDVSSALSGCAAVIHLAASADVRIGEERSREVFENNVLATARLLDAMSAANVRKFGFPSTSTVYGDATVLPTPETYEPLTPISVYGASKLAGEALVHGYAARHDLSAVIWRLANVVGGGATHGVVYDFVEKLRVNSEELEILGREPGTHKSYVHMEDAVGAMLHAWSSVDGRVEAFNVGSQDAISVKEVADLVCRAMGLSNVRYRWTGGVDGGGWKGDVRRMGLAVDKLRSRGWAPRHTSAEAVSRAASELLADR